MHVTKFSKSIIIALSLAGIFISIFPGKTVRVALESLAFATIASYLLNAPVFFRHILLPRKILLYVFFYYSIFVFLHGGIVASSYEQWRILFTSYAPILILPWLAILGSIPEALTVIIKNILLVAVPLSFFFFINGQMGRNENTNYVGYTGYVYIFILFIPYLKFNWRIVIIALSIISLLFNLDNRSNYLGISFSYALLLLMRVVKLNTLIFDPIVKSLRLIFFIIPLVLVTLGYLGVFNIFQYLEERDAEELAKAGGSTDRALAIDSRTGIYQDAVESTNTLSKLVFGISPAAYYKTMLSETLEADYDKGRLTGSEAAILNFFQWGGIAYVLIVFLIFFSTSYLAIFKSNNFLLKNMGVYLSFRWLYLFVENPVLMNFFWVTQFLIIGVCLSPKFRAMNDSDINNYLSNI